MKNKKFTSDYLVQIDSDPESGRILQETWRNSENEIERGNDLPAIIHYDLDSGKQIYAAWFRAGGEHRDGKPARVTTCAETGQLLQQVWSLCGQMHRDQNEPALIEFNPDNGQATKKCFYQFGRLHRPDGPAVEELDPKTGNIIRQDYWKDGRRLQHSPLPLQSPS